MMKTELNLADDLGSHLADGSAALEYRIKNIDPYVAICSEIHLDFSGVRIANSSFINALVAGAIEHNGEEFLEKAVFVGCRGMVRVLVESAIELGEQKLAV